MSKATWVVAVVTVLVLGIGGGLTAALVVGDDGDGGSAAPSGSPSSDPDEGSAPPATSSGPAGVVPEGLEEFYSQQITWEPCGDPQECAELTVPVDYEKPDGDTVQLKLQRVAAADQSARIGSVVVNPGGPGAPGTTLTEDPGYFFGQPLLDRLDVVAFDPRGTGESDPVDCLPDDQLDAFIAQDPSPDDAAEGRELVQEQDEFFDGCVQSSDSLIGHVSTVEAARDMDVLRSVLGEEQLTYLGFSYGTTLGSTYADLFPKNVGRFVLDGATDPALDFKQDALSQAAGFQTALDAYVDDCVDGGDCFLGDSREEGLATIQDLLDQIDSQPLPTSSGRDLEIGNAFYGLVTPLYSKDNWTVLDQGLKEALDGKGDTLLLLSDFYASKDPQTGEYTDNSLEAFLAINCLDDPSTLEPGQVPKLYPEFEKASPTFGKVFAWGLVGCHGIEVQAEEPAPEIDATGAAPIVVVGTTRDPATPYEEAVALAKELDSGVLVTRDGDGHTGYNKGNACVDDAVEGYLLEGTVPDDGLMC